VYKLHEVNYNKKTMREGQNQDRRLRDLPFYLIEERRNSSGKEYFVREYKSEEQLIEAYKSGPQMYGGKLIPVKGIGLEIKLIY